MAEDTGTVDRTEIEKKAKQFGWVPKEDYKGAEGSWLDAPEFVERGEQILPIVQSNNRRLQGQIGQLTNSLSSVQDALKASEATIRALQESHDADTQAQVEATRKQLKEELEAASRDGDHKSVADLTDQMTRLNTAEAKGKGNNDEGEETPRGRPREIPPALKAEVEDWYTRNPEYRTNARKLALGNAVSHEFRAAGDTRVGAAFLDAVAEEVDKALGDGGRTGHSKVSGDNGGRGRQTGSTGGGKTYADLPAEAKTACDKMAARLVGPNRAHKDIASWRSSYVKQYYTE